MIGEVQKLGDELAIRNWVDEAERTGETDIYAAKRAWTRTTWDVAVVVRIASGRHTDELIHARGKDVSLGGIGFLSRRMVPIHTTVEIWAGEHRKSVSGRVMHATQTISGFIMGVAFDTPAPSQTKRVAG